MFWVQNALQDAMKFYDCVTANGKAMPERFKTISFAIIFGAILASQLSACGRKGDLDVPGAYDTQAPQASDAHKVEDKPFILDPLL